jgi:hypothetical protein
METALMKHFGRKAAIAAVAFATVGSTVFGGAALANDDDGKKWKAGDGGDASGKGGVCVIEKDNGYGGLSSIVDGLVGGLMGGGGDDDKANTIKDSCNGVGGYAGGGGFSS